jgi:hypothetical protein
MPRFEMDPRSWEKAKDVIAGALKRSPSERDAFVRDHCPDEALRAEVDALLKEYEEAPDFLEQPPLLDEPDESDQLDDLPPGTHVGPYIIIDRLGRGGMGQVFLGSDPRLNRKVALKCLISTLYGADDRLPRILEEARAAACINHPNVATVHDVIEHESRAFIVMEYVAGESLAARMARERIPMDRVVTIGCQLAAALSAAHARGIIHRDLKPANIQISLDGSAKVLDFGVAKLAQSWAPASSGASTASRSAHGGRGRAGGGTPPYMSPEQLLDRPVDERSDIYSLGVVLFEMATGHRPYATTDALDLLERHAKGAPRADSLDTRVPRELADVIEKALASDLTHRYQSAQEVKTALEGVERRLYIAPPDPPEPIRRLFTRVAMGLGITVVALGGTGFVTTVGFNNTFGRVGEFARFGTEPWGAYFSWGVLAAFPSIVMMTLAALITLAGTLVAGILRLIGPVRRALDGLGAWLRRAAVTADLDNPVVLAQRLTGVSILMLIVLYWSYVDVIRAWTAFFNSSPIERILPMGPTKFARLYYKVTLDVMTLAFGFGLFKVIQFRKRQRVRDGKLVVALQAGVVAILILMNVWSYRTLSYREFERVEWAGARCYITGQSAGEVLILCPSSDPPRNRTVRQNDPGLRRTGIIENVFDGLNAAGPDR